MGRKKATIAWEDGCQGSFDDLNCLCTTVPILTYADFTRPFKFHTNACWSGLGLCSTRLMMMVLMLSLPTPVGVWQRPNLTTLPINWEFLTLKWAVVETFHEYFYGSTFDVYLDNSPLTYVLTTTKLDAASHHWVASLANYNFQLYYRAEKTNINVDSLLRMS